MNAATPDQDQRERRTLLMIIVGIGVLVVVGSVVLSVVGNRQVTDKVDDLRQHASNANVDPSLIAISAYGTDSDPVSAALGSDDVVSLRQQPDNSWCVETEVSALLSSQTVFFVIDENGRFIETTDCR